MFDIGVNLSSHQFDKDRDAVMARARAAGVSGMLLTGTNVPESKNVAVMAREYAGCWATAGVHPHYAAQWNNAAAESIRALLALPEVVAVGECGLDFNRNYSTAAQQERAFNAQLALAVEHQLPVFMHCREAHNRFITLLKPWLGQLSGAVLHCFTGTRDEAETCLELGLYLGITGWVCDERRGLELRALLPHIPAKRLLLETDAPWLLPRDMRLKPASRRNEPCFLPHILAQVAHWRGEGGQWLAQIVGGNVTRLFGIAAD